MSLNGSELPEMSAEISGVSNRIGTKCRVMPRERSLVYFRSLNKADETQSLRPYTMNNTLNIFRPLCLLFQKRQSLLVYSFSYITLKSNSCTE